MDIRANVLPECANLGEQQKQEIPFHTVWQSAKPFQCHRPKEYVSYRIGDVVQDFPKIQAVLWHTQFLLHTLFCQSAIQGQFLPF